MNKADTIPGFMELPFEWEKCQKINRLIHIINDKCQEEELGEMTDDPKGK